MSEMIFVRSAADRLPKTSWISAERRLLHTCRYRFTASSWPRSYSSSAASLLSTFRCKLDVAFTGIFWQSVGSFQSSVLFDNHTNMSQSRKMRFPCLSHSHFCCCRNKDFTAFAVFKVSQGICYVNTHQCNGLRAVPLLISIERMNARVCLTSFWLAKDLANDWIMVATTVFLLWSISWTNTFFRWSSIWYLHDQIQWKFNYWLVKKLSSRDCLVLTCAKQSSYCFNRCLLGFNLFIEMSDKSLCLGHVGIW